jgi:hypothetical protein
MAKDKTITLFLEIDGKQAHITLDSTSLKTKEIQTNLDKVSTKKLNGEFSDLTSTIQQYAGAMGLAFGATEVFQFLKKSIEETSRAQRAIQQLNTALYSTKEISGFTTQELKAMAERLEELNRFKFEDHAIMEAQSKLLTFTNINKNVFEEALQLAMDLSVRFDQDLTASIKQVGKALQEPLTGMTALRRAGVQLSDQQTAQVKLFVQQNNLMGAQRIILDELSRQVSGAAAAGQTEFDEQLGKVNKSIRDMQMGIGSLLIPTLKELGDEFQSLIKVMTFDGNVKGAEFLAQWVKLAMLVPRFEIAAANYGKRAFNAYVAPVIDKTIKDDVVLNPSGKTEEDQPLNGWAQHLRSGRNELESIITKTLKVNTNFDYQKKTVGEIKAHIEELNKKLNTYVKGSKDYTDTITERDKLAKYIKDDVKGADELKKHRQELALDLAEKSQTGLDRELAALNKYYEEKMRYAKGDAKLTLALHNYVEKEKLLKIKDSEIEIRHLIEEMEGYNKDFHNPIVTDMFGRKRADFGELGDATPEEERKSNWKPYDFAQNEYDTKSYKERLADEQAVWDATHKTALAAINSINSGMDTMWSRFIIGNRQAKDDWDAVWLSMRGTAFQIMGEVVNSYLMSQLRGILGSPTDKAAAAGSSGGSGGGDIISTIIGALGSMFGLADGGIVTRPMIAKIGEAGPEAVMPLNYMSSYLGNSNSTKNIEAIMNRKLNQFVGALRDIDTVLTGENIHFAGDRAKKRIKDNSL